MFGLPSFAVYILLALILTKVPIVGKYFRLINTLIHEVGHVLMSLITSGKVYHVKIFFDTSGVATTGSSGRIPRILTSLAGYPFASFISMIFLYLLKVGREEWILYCLVALLVASLVFWVRNWFGFIWTFVYLAGTLVINVYGTDKLILMYLSLVVAVILVESISSAFVVFWLSLKNPTDSGDANNLANSTHIPSLVWGTLFFIQSIYFLQLGYKYWV